MPGAECHTEPRNERYILYYIPLLIGLSSVNHFKMKTATIGGPSRLKAHVLLLAGMVAVVLIGNGKLTSVSR